MLRTLPPAVIGLLLLTPLMIAGGQVLFKLTSQRLAAVDAPFARAVFDPVFILAVALYGVATILWIYVLKTVPLSFAYSFMALSFVFVPLLAMTFLGESVGIKTAIGSAFIIAGLLIVQS
jgi:undecaprenyl phosphate-alpha-L-ara4N flippase subunit ArnE